MYLDLDVIDTARNQIKLSFYSTSMYRLSHRAVTASSDNRKGRMNQNANLWILFELASLLQLRRGFTGDRMPRCAHAAYERLVTDTYHPEQSIMLTKNNIDVALSYMRTLHSSVERGELLDAMETRLRLQQAGHDMHAAAYPLPFATAPGDVQFIQPLSTVKELETPYVPKLHTQTRTRITATPLTSPDGTQDMTRLGFDALHLQSAMSNGQELTIEHIAVAIFGEIQEDGSRAKTKVSFLRAKQAALNMVTLKRAVPIPDRQNMVSIRAKYQSEGVQLEALMNMAVRDGIASRKP